MKENTLMEYIYSNMKNENLPNVLPITHSCEGYLAEHVIGENLLNTSDCDKFVGESLLYFFYGRPSYKVAIKNNESRSDNLYCPVCFIMDVDKIDIYRIFPFDSGAFITKRYKAIHKSMKIEDFEIENKVEFIKAYISLVFNGNEDYLNGNIHVNEQESEILNALFSLLSTKITDDFDERALTIEVLTKKAVYITDAVKCIILPDTLLRKKSIMDFLNENNIQYKTYRVFNLTDPSSYNGVVRQIAYDYVCDYKRR